MALNANWMETKASGGFPHVPAGGYVLRIVDVTNDEKNECLNLVFDVAEGEYKGEYANVDADRNWSHTHKVYHSEKCAGMFKKWLECVEQSNPSFSIAAWQAAGCRENDFIGKLYGAAWNVRHVFRAWQDDEKKRVGEFDTFANYYPADDIRRGAYKLPKEQFVIQDYERGAYTDIDRASFEAFCATGATVAPVSMSAAVDDEDVPF